MKSFVELYDSLRREADDPQQLDFELLRQIWLFTRGDPHVRPSEFALAVLKAMSFAFLLADGRSESGAVAEVVDTMVRFEREYAKLFEQIASEPQKMRRTKWPGNVVPFIKPK